MTFAACMILYLLSLLHISSDRGHKVEEQKKLERCFSHYKRTTVTASSVAVVLKSGNNIDYSRR